VRPTLKKPASGTRPGKRLALSLWCLLLASLLAAPAVASHVSGYEER
jgi:hypothetical protein